MSKKTFEIERRFTVDYEKFDVYMYQRFGTTWHGQGERLLQFYIANDPAVRVRVYSEHTAELTIKGEGTLVRQEVNVPIAVEHAMNLLQFARSRLQKTRYNFVHGDHVWTVDDFGDNHLLAEIELDNEFESFERPAWTLEEVTYDQRFNSARISIDGFPVD